MQVQRATRVGVIVASLLLMPFTAWAQSSITGVVRDTSGGILPGVTVEAASPVLIEKVRSVVSDESGVYRIVEDGTDRKSTRLNSSHSQISYAVLCLKKKTQARSQHSAR